MIDKGSSHNINFNAKSVDAPAAHSCGGKLDKKDCCYSKESIMRSIDALQSKHEQLISDQFTMKMEILNLFTDFANSIVDGIEAVTSIIAVNKFNVSAPPLSDMKNVGGHNNRFNTNWKEVDHVFIPVFMDQKSHWILVDLDMSNLHLDVYNSSFKTIRDIAVLDAVEPLQSNDSTYNPPV
ncbi:Ulp1 protease family [Forsythia ovata]|uniref:Ulp1 protease family n=1 Tax=Forsythia ovata TaxID=205694 RepID=A0ABD1TMQ1_9LAMI